MNLLLCRRGQALIETALSLPLLVLAIAALLILGYRGLVFYMTDYHLHEALVCLDDDTSLKCKKNLEHTIKSFLLFKEPFHVDLDKSKSSGNGQVRIQFSFELVQPELFIKKEMKFPLGS